MVVGSTMAMSSGFEKKELGEVALVSDPEPYVKSTLTKGDKISSTNGMGPSACSDPFNNCNPALCEGQISGFSGKRQSTNVSSNTPLVTLSSHSHSLSHSHDHDRSLILSHTLMLIL